MAEEEHTDQLTTWAFLLTVAFVGAWIAAVFLFIL